VVSTMAWVKGWNLQYIVHAHLDFDDRTDCGPEGRDGANDDDYGLRNEITAQIRDPDLRRMNIHGYDGLVIIQFRKNRMASPGQMPVEPSTIHP